MFERFICGTNEQLFETLVVSKYGYLNFGFKVQLSASTANVSDDGIQKQHACQCVVRLSVRCALSAALSGVNQQLRSIYLA